MLPGRTAPTLLLSGYVSFTGDGPSVWIGLLALALWWAIARWSPFLGASLLIAATYLHLLTTR